MSATAKILIIDDFEDSADITAAFLEDGGFTDVDFARSAQEAYAILGIEPAPEAPPPAFDLVICDIVLPEIDGIETCARIRLHPSYRDLPILMLSAIENVELLNQAFMAGANDFVRKPVDQISLLARVRSLLRLKREQERRRAREEQLERQSRDLQRGVLDKALVDPNTMLASAAVIDLTLRSCAQHGDSACLALIRIDAFAAYETEHGREEADRLMRTVASVLAATPAPLSSILTALDRSTFIVVGPRPSGTVPLQRTCSFAREDMAARAFPHGNSVFGDYVTLSTAVAMAPAEELDGLLKRLLTGFEAEWRQGNSHIDVD
ncbi:response regulator [Solirhodobacter olei]|uniref:response regulator n=1 Tax=Solirhodobacter olei TaxID=2493082 RepID=UPI000FD8A921|nr:response regulator [Solirhodobacter olei]